MPGKDVTKMALAQGLKDLLRMRKLSHITVGDIVRWCDTSRNTFYYHFSDKYDLIHWIFYSETYPIVQEARQPDQWGRCFAGICRYMYDNRAFYLEAFDYAGQNSLEEYLRRYCCELMSECLEPEGLQPPEAALLARMAAHAYVGVLMDWARDGMREDYETRFRCLPAVRSRFAGAEKGGMDCAL